MQVRLDENGDVEVLSGDFSEGLDDFSVGNMNNNNDVNIVHMDNNHVSESVVKDSIENNLQQVSEIDFLEDTHLKSFELIPKSVLRLKRNKFGDLLISDLKPSFYISFNISSNFRGNCFGIGSTAR